MLLLFIFIYFLQQTTGVSSTTGVYNSMFFYNSFIVNYLVPKRFLLLVLHYFKHFVLRARATV